MLGSVRPPAGLAVAEPPTGGDWDAIAADDAPMAAVVSVAASFFAHATPATRAIARPRLSLLFSMVLSPSGIGRCRPFKRNCWLYTAACSRVDRSYVQ